MRTEGGLFLADDPHLFSGVFALLVEWAPLAQDVRDEQHNAKFPTLLTEMSPALVMQYQH